MSLHPKPKKGQTQAIRVMATHLSLATLEPQRLIEESNLEDRLSTEVTENMPVCLWADDLSVLHARARITATELEAKAKKAKQGLINPRLLLALYILGDLDEYESYGTQWTVDGVTYWMIIEYQSLQMVVRGRVSKPDEQWGAQTTFLG